METRTEEQERGEPEAETLLERSTLCMPDFERDTVSHCGDDGFKSVLQQYFRSPESNAAERLVKLKDRLRPASTHDFWTILMEEMCAIAGAQCGFVAKRILMDDENTAVEMPPLGEPGSCLLGVAFYLNDGHDFNQMYHDYRYHAYGSPCAHMKHDKVFIIPERMIDFVPNNPNTLPWKQSESFIGLPLFHEGKCFAHFGMIWSTEGAPKRQLSWTFIEMFLHSLEEMILQRILEGKGFAKEPTAPQDASARIIPLDAITASQSLKPYARSLSHELRTPMQGVVGMLDIMHSTVMDAMASQTTQTAKSIFEELKSNIEVVQESSKRAVEAADNVVHAYDLNMQMPETPLATDDDAGSDESLVTPGTGECHRPDIVIEGNGISSLPNNGKRRRSEEIDFHPGPPLKRLTGMAGVGPRRVSAPLSHASDIVAESSDVARRGSDSCPSQVLDGAATIEYTSRRSSEAESPTRSTAITSQNSGNIVTREFLSALVNDSTHNIHLVHKTRTQTELGEIFQISTAGPRNQLRDLAIHIIVEPDVPDTIVAEEQHLQFALQKVVDNAIKFTESGTIRIAVSMARNAQLVEIGVSDTGCGITEESKAHLFKPHFQEDASISRAKDGLGLSLFNAKAHVRKNLGGDLTLERSATEGPNKGSEFLIRLPTSGPLEYSRPNTPRMGTPVPVSYSGSRQGSPPVPAMRALPPAPTSVPTPRRESLVAGKSVPTPRRDSLNPPNSAATPRRESLTSTTQASRSRKQPGFNPNLAKILPLNIMVAEDNAINRKLLVTYLKKLGYPKDRVVQAFDGVEAVQQYKMSLSRPPDKRIDVILMDLWMPNMDGYEATTKIYEIAEEHGENLGIMAVTADITSDSFERATEVGMQGFLTKPYTLLDIENMLLQHFHKD